MTQEIRLAALCDHALVAQDGKVSMLGIFQNISVSGLPAQHPRMYLVAILSLDVGQHSVVVRLRDPSGTASLGEPPQMGVRAIAGQDVNVIVEMNNVAFTAYGQHRFDLEVDGRAIGTLPLTIVQMPGSPGSRSN